MKATHQATQPPTPAHPQLPPIITTPATVEACAADYATRDQTGQAAHQHGAIYAAAQDGIPTTPGQMG